MVGGDTVIMKRNKKTHDDEETKKISREDRIYLLRELTKALSEVFTKEKSLLDKTLEKHLGDKSEDLYDSCFSVPLYQKWQAAYAIQEFTNRKCQNVKLVSYSSSAEKLKAPSYQEVEVKRDIMKPIVTFGWRFFKWKGVSFAACSDFGGRNSSTTFWSHKKDKKKVSQLIAEINEYMKSHNYLKGEKLKVIDGCIFEFLEYSKHSFEEIILDPSFKQELILNLLFPLKNEALCKEFSIPWRRGVLIGGEPGTGKTKLAKVLCNVLDCTVLWVSTESIKEPWEMKQVFEGARMLSPTLIIFEDVDFLGTDREIDRNPILGELLNQLDGNSPNHGIFVLASTNRPNLLDKALANRPGRFDLKLELTKPNRVAREQLINLFMKGKPSTPNIRFDKLAEETNGLTGSHIQEVITYGILDALYSGSRVLTEENLRKGLYSVKGRDNRNNVMSR